MATRRRCIECRDTFTPSPRAEATQVVCGPACRARRDRKLARARRRKDVDGYREDERLRQQQSRAARAAAVTPGAPASCHAPPSGAKLSMLHAQFAAIVDRVLEQSRASLVREISLVWARRDEDLAEPRRPSRATFRAQAQETPP